VLYAGSRAWSRTSATTQPPDNGPARRQPPDNGPDRRQSPDYGRARRQPPDNGLGRDSHPITARATPWWNRKVSRISPVSELGVKKDKAQPTSFLAPNSLTALRAKCRRSEATTSQLSSRTQPAQPQPGWKPEPSSALKPKPGAQPNPGGKP